MTSLCVCELPCVCVCVCVVCVVCVVCACKYPVFSNAYTYSYYACVGREGVTKMQIWGRALLERM